MKPYGFKSMTVRILDGETSATKDSNLFTIEGEPNKGATQKVSIKGLSPEISKIFGSNKAYHVSRKGVGNVTADVEILDIARAALEAFLGYQQEGGITSVGDNTEAPYCSVLFESELLTGEPFYFALVKGTFSSDEVDGETHQEKKSDPGATKLTFTAVTGDGDNKGICYRYYVGKEETEINKLKALLKMLPTG